MTWDNGDEFAFPVPPFTEPNGEFRWPEMGLTKRELFAAMMMHAMVSRESAGLFTPETTASTAVICADALLRELGSTK